MPKKFSIEEAFEFAWEVTKKNFVLLLGFLIVAGVVSSISFTLAAPFEKKIPLLFFILSVIGWVVQTIVAMGLFKIAIKFANGQKGDFSDLFACASSFIPYVLGSLLYSLIVLGGLILLIVPGIIWAIRYQFFPYFIIDKKCKVFEALQKSSDATQGAKWRLFIVGVMTFFIGLFVTIPITMVATAYVYLRLSSAQTT